MRDALARTFAVDGSVSVRVLAATDPPMGTMKVSDAMFSTI